MIVKKNGFIDGLDIQVSIANNPQISVYFLMTEQTYLNHFVIFHVRVLHLVHNYVFLHRNTVSQAKTQNSIVTVLTVFLLNVIN